MNWSESTPIRFCIWGRGPQVTMAHLVDMSFIFFWSSWLVLVLCHSLHPFFPLSPLSYLGIIFLSPVPVPGFRSLIYILPRAAGDKGRTRGVLLFFLILLSRERERRGGLVMVMGLAEFASNALYRDVWFSLSRFVPRINCETGGEGRGGLGSTLCKKVKKLSVDAVAAVWKNRFPDGSSLYVFPNPPSLGT
ncbi:hypothetical protein F4809DRAFT_636349 [Biscogniauxia mediterranea]|nr:hypothetical protein F4809DRAFT_636349 [Biscogniauxia mediterranea]